jgi:ABC-type nitrate/sulfonate/bicarbonate transport system ATPase subunit
MTIEIRDLTKRFGHQGIFEEFNADIATHQATAIIGESGLGKTTLLRMIAGLDTAYTGNICNVPPRLTFLFQENLLLPWKNVVENIAFPVMDIMPEREREGRIEKLLALTYLSGHENKYPHELSGGMQRRVALCRALIYPATLLLLDEPFSGLDSAMKDRIADSVWAHLVRQKTLVIVTHDASIIARCDAIIDCNGHTSVDASRSLSG